MNDKKRRAVLWDLDGTLVNVSGIRYLLGTEGGLDAFHEASADCPPNELVAEAARHAHLMGFVNLVFSGCRERHRPLRTEWLRKHNIPYTELHMRADDDNRKDFAVKLDMYNSVIGTYDVVHAWDDRPAAVDLWLNLRLLVTIVPGWEEPPAS